MILKPVRKRERLPIIVPGKLPVRIGQDQRISVLVMSARCLPIFVDGERHNLYLQNENANGPSIGIG
jgi:hypothetical protein